jgi:hypothetical protein
VTATLKEADFTPQPSQGISTFTDAMRAVITGGTYMVVSTQANPSGEIRGHVGRMSFNPNLTGGSVVPPVTTTANGDAQVTISSSRKQINVFVNAYGATDLTGETINVGKAGENGPPVFVVTDAAVAPNDFVIKSLQATDLQLSSGAQGISSFADAVHAIITSQTYLLITSTDFPGGRVPAGTDRRRVLAAGSARG